jgi:hypothetical protein
MLFAALAIALVLDALATLAAVALWRRTTSTFLRSVAAGFAATTIVATTAVASLTTATVQTRIVMAGLARREPTATILSTDAIMRTKIRDAVVRGLDAPGGKVEGVKREVGAVLRPYMTYRLANAPDAYVVRSARATRDLLGRASAEGAATCRAVLSGDVGTVARLATPASSAWLPDMLRADALDRPRTASQADVVRFVGGVAQARGWTQADLADALQRRGRLACDYPIVAIDAAVALPEDRAAALLRTLGLGGSVGISR